MSGKLQRYADNFHFFANEDVINLVFLAMSEYLSPDGMQMKIQPEIVGQITMSHSCFKRFAEACAQTLINLPEAFSTLETSAQDDENNVGKN